MLCFYAFEEHINILQKHFLFGLGKGVDLLHPAKQLQAQIGCIAFKRFYTEQFIGGDLQGFRELDDHLMVRAQFVPFITDTIT